MAWRGLAFQSPRCILGTAAADRAACATGQGCATLTGWVHMLWKLPMERPPSCIAQAGGIRRLCRLASVLSRFDIDTKVTRDLSITTQMFQFKPLPKASSC
jgi:hypothetical protein